MTTPTYIIYRDITAGQPYDPTAPIIFYPAKDSDELFDALRAKYPHLKTHSERMRDAVIEFLLEERMTETSDLPSLPDVDLDSTLWQEWPSVSPTNLSTPETASIATPAFTNSPYQASRQHESSSNATSPAELDQMTSVFSLTTADQPRQRVRRKMTDAEKVEYRKRRIMKACEKCSKRKRKCTHNGDESTTGLNTDRINKISTSNTKKSATQKSEIMKEADIFASLDPQLAGEFGDFTLLPQQTNKDVEFNDLFALQNDVGFDMANWYDGTDYAALNYNRVPSLQHSSSSSSSNPSTPCVPGDQGSQSPDGCIAPSCLQVNPRQPEVDLFAMGRLNPLYKDIIKSRSAQANSTADQLAFYEAGANTINIPTTRTPTTRRSTNDPGVAAASGNASMASHNTISAASGNAMFEDIAAASTANASKNAQSVAASKNARTRSEAVAAAGHARKATGDAANVNATKISGEVAATNNAGMIHEKIAAANINAKTNLGDVAACTNAKASLGVIAAASNAGSHQQDGIASRPKNIPRNVAAANNDDQEDHQHQESAFADLGVKSKLVHGLSARSLRDLQLQIQSVHPTSSHSDRTGLSISRQRSSSPSAELFMSRRHIPSSTNTVPADLHNTWANMFQAMNSTDLDGRHGFHQQIYTATPTTPFRRRSEEVSVTKISSGQSVAPSQEILKVSYPEAAQSEADTGRKMDHFWVRDHHGRTTTTSTSQLLSHICISLLCFAWLCGLFFAAPTPALILSSITYGFVHTSAGFRSSGARSLQRIDRLFSRRFHNHITTFTIS